MSIDLEKAGKLGFDIKKLESRKNVLEGETERLETKINKDRKDAEKELTKLLRDNEDSIKVRLNEVGKKEVSIEKKLKTISIREVESQSIEEDRKKLSYARAEIAEAKKIVEANNIKCLEMTNLAKLRSEQLAKTLEDLGKKPKTLEDVKKKSVKKVKK